MIGERSGDDRKGGVSNVETFSGGDFAAGSCTIWGLSFSDVA